MGNYISYNLFYSHDDLIAIEIVQTEKYIDEIETIIQCLQSNSPTIIKNHISLI